MDAELRWDAAWRERTWSGLADPWDLIVVGGGIVGAGILRAAARTGVRALLLERRDFASGTSSRSSQLVHGGLRYLAQGQLGLARSAVSERERLLRDSPGLVTPIDFLFPFYSGERGKRLAYAGALTAYDALAGRRSLRRVTAPDFALLSPSVHPLGMIGGLRYREAQTDDARLVLSVLREAVGRGARALNYAPVTSVLHGRDGVCGVQVRDDVSGREMEVRATVVVNATGAWADVLRAEVGGAPRMRPLKGSHLVFPATKFPVSIGVNVAHPGDGRPITVTPWQGATVVGTTDLDHRLDDDVSITAPEVEYLLAALASPFRCLGVSHDDVVATWSGVRPTVFTGAASASRELRAHVVWDEDGLLTVTGGKLTTFRLIAQEALQMAARRLPAGSAGRSPAVPAGDSELLGFDESAGPREARSAAEPLGGRHGREAAGPREAGSAAERLGGRHGHEAAQVVQVAEPGELEPLAGTPVTAAELRWAARCEGVAHLDDLLLRRVRLGLLLPDGGAEILPVVRRICQQELSWTDGRWADEQAAYAALVARCHSVPG
jgi:glycerol-3-phosphate dehydrogenase